MNNRSRISPSTPPTANATGSATSTACSPTSGCRTYAVYAPAMMNSPCAMLMTPIWPNVKVRPSAASSSTAPMLAPMTNWFRVPMARSGRQAGGPRIALEVRIRLHRLPGVPHLLDLAVRLDQADPGGLEDVLVLPVDRDLPLGQIQRDPAGRLLDRLDLGAARLGGRGGPELDRVVAGLH